MLNIFAGVFCGVIAINLIMNGSPILAAVCAGMSAVNFMLVTE